MQERCGAELLEELEVTFAAALESVSAAMPGRDLRVRGWAPAEPLQASYRCPMRVMCRTLLGAYLTSWHMCDLVALHTKLQIAPSSHRQQPA